MTRKVSDAIILITGFLLRLLPAITTVPLAIAK